MNKLISMVLVACFATLPLCGCVAQEPDEDLDVDIDEPTPTEQGKEAPSCDDFDTWCGPTRPCGKGLVCAYVPGQCGQNVSGTYPYCVATAACYPVCTPGEKD